MRRAWRWVGGGLTLAVTLPLVALLVTVWASGWRVSAVQSGSMAPNVPRGAAVLIDGSDPEDIGVGSVIAFRDPNDADRTVVHRVHRVVDGPSGRAFETRGDHNAVPDRDLVPVRLVQGEVVHHVLGLGAVVDWVGDAGNAWLLIAVPLAVLVANEVLARRQRRRAQVEEGELGALRARVAELEAALSSPLRA